MSQTIIQDEALFHLWCKMLASEILKSNILNEDSITTTIKVSILDNKQLFIDCLMDRLDYNISKLKIKASKLGHPNDRSKYLKIGLELSVLNSQKKELNKAKIRDNTKGVGKRKAMWSYIFDNHPEIADTFMKKYNQSN